MKTICGPLCSLSRKYFYDTNFNIHLDNEIDPRITVSMVSNTCNTTSVNTNQNNVKYINDCIPIIDFNETIIKSNLASGEHVSKCNVMNDNSCFMDVDSAIYTNSTDTCANQNSDILPTTERKVAFYRNRTCKNVIGKNAILESYNYVRQSEIKKKYSHTSTELYRIENITHIRNEAESNSAGSIVDINTPSDKVDVQSKTCVTVLSQNSLYSGKKLIKMCHINVSGFHGKLDMGILDQYLSEYDIIFLNECNTENPILKDTQLEDFNFIVKHKCSDRHKFKYGGVHGIMVLFKNNLEGTIEEIPSKTECVLWIKFINKNTFQGIFGCTYIPCESSKYYYHEIFDEIENDVIELRAKFKLPICL